jgi:hypothetical protein
VERIARLERTVEVKANMATGGQVNVWTTPGTRTGWPIWVGEGFKWVTRTPKRTRRKRSEAGSGG